MDEADHADSWAAAAFIHPELAAHQILRLKNPCWNPGSPAVSVSVSADWGSHGRRSRTGAGPRKIRIRHPKACRAAESPATPMDFGSGSASASGSDEASSSLEKKKRTADDDVSGGGVCATKVGGIDQQPLGLRIPAAKDIRRSGKKKTVCELQEEEKILLEEKIMLQKEVELGRKAYKALQVENKRLKSRQLSLQPEMAPAVAMVSSTPSSTSQFLLPDLNEPLSDNLD